MSVHDLRHHFNAFDAQVRTRRKIKRARHRSTVRNRSRDERRRQTPRQRRLGGKNIPIERAHDRRREIDHPRAVFVIEMEAGEIVRPIRLRDVDLASGCVLETQSFALPFATSEQKEGMSAFVEKRPGNWKGR